MSRDAGAALVDGTPFAWGPALGAPVRARVVQCALSRICGVCAGPLGRPVAFVATPRERGRNAIHAPPMHLACAEELRAMPGADRSWEVVLTAGFEFVRPGRDEPETEPVFSPNSLL